MWISGGISHRLCHGGQPRFGKPSATRLLPASLAGCSKMVAQSPQAHWSSQGENGITILFPISASTGLHHVHPTWAGTFVLAALVAMFPGINFVLLDSDCLPVTLFEVEDLWTEAYLARFPAHCESGIPQAHPLRALARFSKDPQVVYTQSRVCSTRMGQGALVVTEPHAELNAGLIVIFRSSHPPLFDWNAWSLRLRSSPGSITDDEFKDEASNLAFAFWDRIGEFLKRSRTGSELSSDEKTLWIQSGLAISPLMGTCLQYSLDFCLAWALIGEWTSRVLFPVPKGPWPRHGHAGALLQNYQCRSPRIVAWARAAFEQGALPSLLMMPGIAPVFSLPGDRMFQATEITAGRQRPAIMHAYGGAKVGMERSLASIAAEGWIPMAVAMLGTAGKPPMWASVGLRPVAGTTIDFRVLPPILLKGRNCLCSRAGNSGMPLVSRALPCPNGLLELMWTLDRMDVTPLPS